MLRLDGPICHRRARACPSPALGITRDHGGNPLGCADGIRGPPRYGIRNGLAYRRARACPSPSCMNREIARACPSPYRPGTKNARGTAPRATKPKTLAGETRSDARMASEGPRATFISLSSPHQTSSTSDLPQTRARATYASLTSPAYHPTRLPQSGSNTQPPASQTYP